MAERANFRETVRRMTKQLVDSGVPVEEARKQAIRAAQRRQNPRAAKRDHFEEKKRRQSGDSANV